VWTMLNESERKRGDRPIIYAAKNKVLTIGYIILKEGWRASLRETEIKESFRHLRRIKNNKN
jgi:hypothetical protein